MAAVSYDAVFLNGLLAPFYPSGWAVVVAAAAVAASGAVDLKSVRGRSLSFAIAFAVAYLLLHLYDTGLGSFLLQHRLPAAIGLAAVLMLEGLSVVGMRNLWASIRRRSGTTPDYTDNVTAAVLGAGMAFAVSLVANQPALARAAELSDAGHLGQGVAVTLAAALGGLLALLIVLHLLQALYRRLGHETWRMWASGSVMVVLSMLIALQQIR